MKEENTNRNKREQKVETYLQDVTKLVGKHESLLVQW